MTYQKIADVYYTPGAAGSFQGPVELYQSLRKKDVNITLADVTKWLNRQHVYTMNRMARHKFDKGTIIANSLSEQWHADLAYFGQWSSDNNDVQYLLIIIDVFSIQLQVSPLKNKTGKDIVDAYSKLTTLPKTLRTDEGSEFTNKLFQSFLKNNSIRHYIGRNDSKAALAERVIQTLKRKIYQQMVYKNTPDYISTLCDIVNSYNKTKHANMGYAPNTVTDDNSHEVRLSRYSRTKKKKTLKFKFYVVD